MPNVDIRPDDLFPQLPNGEIRTEDIVGERLIMTYLERRLAAAPWDRMSNELASVQAEPAVAELVRKK